MLGWIEGWLPLPPPQIERKVKLFYNGYGTVDLEEGSVVPAVGDNVWPHHALLKRCYVVTRVDHHTRTENTSLGHARTTHIAETLVTLEPVGER